MPAPVRAGDPLRQAIAVAAIALLAGGSFVAVARRPADRAEMRAAVGELRSQAAELGTLVALTRAGRLNRVFVREHARQLLDHVERGRETLATRSVRPSLAAVQGVARQASGELAGGVRTLRDGGDLRDAAAAAAKVSAAMRGLETSLR